MIIKEVKAKSVKDSRGQKTIQVIVSTFKNKFATSAPAGKSKGEYEAKSYSKSLEGDIEVINGLDFSDLNLEIFEDLIEVEKLCDDRIGANSLFALEASLLKALADEDKCELWEWIVNSFSKGKKDSKFDVAFPRPVGNAIGGGVHSRGVRGKKPDFQEFLFIADGNSFSECVEINKKAYALAGKYLKRIFKRKNDEGAWETNLSNEEVLDIMKKVKEELKKNKIKVDIGMDCAASSFFKNGYYEYKNFHKELDRNAQIKYIEKLVKKYSLAYVEDPFEENDFDGFTELIFEVRKNNCFIVGDDLTTTNPFRLEKAIRLHSIDAIIVKPNQIGSLLKVKRVIDIAKKAGIKTIISHRSGETMDDTIADLCIGFKCDFIKTGIYGKVREVKLERFREIEGKGERVKFYF